MAQSLISRFYMQLRKAERRPFLAWMQWLHPRRPAAQEVRLAAYLAEQPDAPTEHLRTQLNISPGAFRQVQSRLSDGFRTFFALQHLEKQPVLTRLLALETLANRADPHLVRLELRETVRQLERQPWRDGPYYELRYLLARLTHHLVASTKDPSYDETMAALQVAQMQHTAYEQLKLACAALNRQSRTHNPALPESWRQRVSWLATYQPDPPDPVLRLYQDTFAALSQPQVLAPRALWEAFDAQSPRIRPVERLNLFSYLQNNLIHHINEDHSPELSAFALARYEKALQEGYLYQDDGQLLHRIHLHNLVALALRTGQPERARQHLETRIAQVPAAEREETEVFLQGLIAIETAEYREAKRCFARGYRIASLARQARWHALKAQYLAWRSLPQGPDSADEAERLQQAIVRELHSLREAPAGDRLRLRLILLGDILISQYEPIHVAITRQAIEAAALPDRDWFLAQLPG
ncbi:MAG: hypothetical protein D6722_09850 [Bacteroidetes bacterium]|nr:MAG: hypothetical protein D6722_09850 [Bacteroidota bacterium]